MNERQRRQIYNAQGRKYAKYEAQWTPIIIQALNRGTNAVAQSLEQNGYQYTYDHVDELITADAINSVLYRLYRTIGIDSANYTYGYIQRIYGDEMRDQKAFGFNDIWSDIMTSFFRAFGAINVTRINENERRRIRNIIINAQENSVDAFDLARQLRSDDVNLQRGRLIGRTETGIAASAGGDAGARRSGLVMNKTWLSGRDKRTRRQPPDSSDHYHMNNVQVTMDEPFLVPGAGGVDSMAHPHAAGAPANQVCNCRCKVIYEAARDANGRLIRNR